MSASGDVPRQADARSARRAGRPGGNGTFRARTDGPAYTAMARAMEEAYGREPTTGGQGGSIPLGNTLERMYPDAGIMMMGVEEPKCLIHAPNESVDPAETERQALAEALFLRAYGQTG